MVFVIGPDDDCVIRNNPDYIKDVMVSYGFKEYEFKSILKTLYNMFGDDRRSDMYNFANNELLSSVDLSLSIGERVVLFGNYSGKNKRDPFIDIAKKYRVPVFYAIFNHSLYDTSTSHARKQKEQFVNNYDLFTKGDGGTATVVIVDEEDIHAINKFNGIDTIKELRKRGFTGITQVSDAHGNYNSLVELSDWATSRGNILLSTGDIIDYGTENVRCINLVYDKLVRGNMITCMGNHERKIEKWIDSARFVARYGSSPSELRLSDGNNVTIREFNELSQKEFIIVTARLKTIINLSRHHYVFGNTMFVHAAADPKMFNNTNTRLLGKYETLALYGEIDNERKKDQHGYPTRLYNWVDRIPEGKQVIVGHDIRSYDMIQKYVGALGGIAYFTDTGCSKGGKLSSIDLTIDNDKLKVTSFNMR